MFSTENVYNLIPKPEEVIVKPPRYISKYRSTVVLESKLTKDYMRTMGPAKVDVPCPEQFLKKHSKEHQREQLFKSTKEGCTACAYVGGRRPSVPPRSECPPPETDGKKHVMKLPTLVPPKPTPISVDSHKGHKQILENSGLVPKYVMKKNYGEVPTYLQQRTEAERRAQEEIARRERERREQEAMQQLTDDERETIMQNLKKKWDALYHEYQLLPVVIDNLSKKAHKLRLEAEMRQLEKDITLFERFQTIYIAKE